MPEIQVSFDQVADITGCEILHPLMGHRDRHGKINARAGRQQSSGSLLCQRLVEFRQAVEDFIFRRAGIKGDGVVVPEGLWSRSNCRASRRSEAGICAEPGSSGGDSSALVVKSSSRAGSVIGIGGGVMCDSRRRASISADMAAGSEFAAAAEGQKMCHGVGAAASISESLTRLVSRKSPTGPGAPFRIKMSAASWSGWLGQCRSSQARHRRAASSTAFSRSRAGQSARPTSQSSRLW